ncbi:MAG TPA: peptidoglycan-binding domain-containing protein [Beijerinckiaceae bacterium]|nr:peptidoglycan-binding domain-containing protein [Beijerinckiaceae bacterium]
MTALAQSPTMPAAQPSLRGYSEARRAFDSLPVQDRMRLEMLLVAAGYLRPAANERFSAPLLQAIQDFQRDNGLAPDGVLSGTAVARLQAEAGPFLTSWDMQQRFHIFTMQELWVPVGLLQIAQPISTGMRYTDPFGRARMEHSFIEDGALAASYRRSLETARAERGTVTFRIIRPDFYTVAWTSADGGGTYMRYHRSGTGLYGFSLFWNRTARTLEPDRIATLVSMSLTWALRGRALIDPATILRPAPAIVVSAPTP